MTEYKIVYGDKKEVEEKVNELLKDGWELNGDIFVSRTSSDGWTQFTQSMIKKSI